LEEVRTPWSKLPEPLEFDPSPDKSFVPHMIALAKEHGFLLHFHRIKKRPPVDPAAVEDLALVEYLRQLEAFVESQGCAYTDETPETSLTREMYVDPSHLNDEPQHQRPYMDLFWRLVKPSLAPAFSLPAPTSR